MTTWAVPGAKVVCIDARQAEERGIKPPAGYKWRNLETCLAKGAVYTVREVWFNNLFGRWQVSLAEITREFEPAVGRDAGFSIDRFRPLVTSTREADTAMFLSLLKSTDPLDRALMLLDLF